MRVSDFQPPTDKTPNLPKLLSLCFLSYLRKPDSQSNMALSNDPTSPNELNLASLSIDSDGHQGLICGPLLRYSEINYDSRTWYGSCLIVSKSTDPPSLKVTLPSTAGNDNSSSFEFTAECIDTYRQQYRFWRYPLALPLTREPQKATYNCGSDSDHGQHSFHLPGLQETMRFMFHSCNGFSMIPQEVKDKYGDQLLWQDVLDRHYVMPFHVLIGGGDQLYQDKIIKEDFMQPWNDEKSPDKRLAMTMSQNMMDGMEAFFFRNYIENFG